MKFSLLKELKILDILSRVEIISSLILWCSCISILCRTLDIANRISWIATSGYFFIIFMSGSSAVAIKLSLSSLGRWSISSAALLKRSYSCKRRINEARGSSSSISFSFGRSILDLISASIAAINRYSETNSSCIASIKFI